MKKGLLSLLAVVLTVVGCQNYDDQFAALTKDIAAINTTLAGLATVSADVSALKTTVSGIQSGVTANGAASTALTSALAAAQTDIDAIEAAVAGVASAADLTAVSTALTAVQADVKEILAANSVINQPITINSVATLEYVESLISTATDSPSVIINSTVTVTTDNSVFTADQLARVNAVTNKIGTVLGEIYANAANASNTAVIEFNSLAFADSNVYFTVAPKIPLLKTITGNVLLADYTGDLDYSTLSNVGGTFEVNDGLTSLNLAGVTIAGAISTTGSASGQLNLPSATSVDVGTASVIYVDADKATTVKLGNTGTLASLQVDAAVATQVDISATIVSGAFGTAVGTPTKVFANSVTGIDGTVTVSDNAEFHATSLVWIKDGTIAAEVVNLPVWNGTASGTMVMAGAHTAGLNLPAAVLTTNELTAANAKIITVKSTTAALLTAAAIENLTITSLAPTINFVTDAGFATLKTLTVTGEAAAAPDSTTQANTVVVNSNAAVITDLTVGGTVNDVIAYGAALLKNITLSGAIRDISVIKLTVLESLSIGTTHIEGSLASTLLVKHNPVLASIKPTSMSEVKSISINQNPLLQEIDFSVLTAVPDGTTAIGDHTDATTTQVSMTVNGLKATYIPFVAAAETSAAVETKIKQNDILSIRPYITALAATGVNTPAFTFDIAEVVVGTAAPVSLTTAIGAEAAAGHTIAGDFIDLTAELALVEAE